MSSNFDENDSHKNMQNLDFIFAKIVRNVASVVHNSVAKVCAGVFSKSFVDDGGWKVRVLNNMEMNILSANAQTSYVVLPLPS